MVESLSFQRNRMWDPFEIAHLLLWSLWQTTFTTPFHPFQSNFLDPHMLMWVSSILFFFSLLFFSFFFSFFSSNLFYGPCGCHICGCRLFSPNQCSLVVNLFMSPLSKKKQIESKSLFCTEMFTSQVGISLVDHSLRVTFLCTIEVCQ